MNAAIVNKVLVDGKEFLFALDKSTPLFLVGQQTFAHFYDLLLANPNLAKPENLIAYAKTISFECKGLGFRYIEDVTAFQKAYTERLAYESSFSGPLPQRLSNYGIYDVSKMHAPKIVDGRLLCFFEDVYSGLPYQLSVPHPMKNKQMDAKYTLLPFKV